MRFTEVAALNNAFDPNNYIVVDGISVENILLDTSNNGLNYGTKYKFQVRAGNDAGTLADNDWSATEFTTMADYTSIPPAPPISRLDTLNIATKLWDGDWDEVYQYENVSADSFQVVRMEYIIVIMILQILGQNTVKIQMMLQMIQEGNC